MGKKALKVVIAGRNYPLSINEEEEETVLEAVNKINTSIKKLQESYAVKDMQDLLAMTALKLATIKTNPTKVQNNDTQQKEMEEVLADLKSLASSISN